MLCSAGWAPDDQPCLPTLPFHRQGSSETKCAWKGRGESALVLACHNAARKGRGMGLQPCTENVAGSGRHWLRRGRLLAGVNCRLSACVLESSHLPGDATTILPGRETSSNHTQQKPPSAATSHAVMCNPWSMHTLPVARPQWWPCNVAKGIENNCDAQQGPLGPSSWMGFRRRMWCFVWPGELVSWRICEFGQDMTCRNTTCTTSSSRPLSLHT